MPSQAGASAPPLQPGVLVNLGRVGEKRGRHRTLARVFQAPRNQTGRLRSPVSVQRAGRACVAGSLALEVAGRCRTRTGGANVLGFHVHTDCSQLQRHRSREACGMRTKESHAECQGGGLVCWHSTSCAVLVSLAGSSRALARGRSLLPSFEPVPTCSMQHNEAAPSAHETGRVCGESFSVHCQPLLIETARVKKQDVVAVFSNLVGPSESVG